MAAIPGTEGYAAEADSLAVRYEGYGFEATHGSILEHLPTTGWVLDIGAGTGRDAGGFAARGHQVLAVEPTAEMRAHGQRLHPDPRIIWLDDSLPRLERVLARDQRFAIVMLTAVWMHLDVEERRSAMPHVAELVAPGGVMAFLLRYGPVPPGRRMFEVSPQETAALAAEHGFEQMLLIANRRDKSKRDEVTWSRLVLRKS